MNKDKVYVFTYGTLMQGGRNNSVMGNSKYICDATIKQHICFGLPYGFPCVIDLGINILNNVVGEVWEVPIKQLDNLDILEGYDKFRDDGMYLRREIIATDTLGKEYKCFYYVWNNELVEDSYIVPTGEKWKEWKL